MYRLVQFPQQNAQTTTFLWFHFWVKWIKMYQTIDFTYEKYPGKCFNMLSVFPVNEFWYFCPWFFCLKSCSKKYATLSNNCVNKGGFICVDTRTLIWNWYQMKIYFGWKVSQSNVSESQNSSFHLTSSRLMWRPLHLRRDEDLSCLLNPLMCGIQKCSTYKNYCFKADLD